MTSFTVSIDRVRPSQLYVDQRKLRRVLDWFTLDGYDPLPVIELDGDLVLTDGHTRAFAAHLRGAAELRVAHDEDDLPLDVYRTCLGWCREEGVTSVADFAGRVIDDESYEVLWIERCRTLGDQDA